MGMPQQQQQQQYPPAPIMPPAAPPVVPIGGRPEDAAPHITVSDPVQHTEGMNKYTSYRVDVRPVEQPGATQDSIFQNAAYSAVLRRYSDFLWLYERLHRERAGAIVPPLPEKQAVARFTPAFVEERRVALEAFVRRVSVHPELHDAPSLDTFLRADDVTFHAAKNAKDPSAASGMMMSASMNPYGGGMASMPVAGAGAQPKKEGIKRWFAEAKTSISGDLVRSPDDDLFEEIERYVNNLDAQMRNVSMQASGLVRKGKEIANGLFEFGLAFNLLGQSEADALGDALGRVGEAADSLSVLSADHADREAARFEKPLAEYVKTVHAVKLALGRRHEKRLTYTTCLQEVNAKNAALAKLRATPGAEGKAYTAELSLRRAQDAADAARDEFMTVGQRVLREVDRFKREKADEMRRTVTEYIELQIEHNRRMEEIWTALIPALERLGTEEEGMPLPSPAPGAPQQLQQGQGQLPPASALLQQSPPAAAPQPPVQQQTAPAPVPQQQQQQVVPPVGGADPNAPMGGGVFYRDNSLPGGGGASNLGGNGAAIPDPSAMGGGIQYRM